MDSMWLFWTNGIARNVTTDSYKKINQSRMTIGLRTFALLGSKNCSIYNPKSQGIMETDELISTLGVGYIDEMLQEYEHDCQWLQQIKADLGPQSRNMLNKANATLRCAMNDLKMLQETMLKEHLSK